MYYVMARAIAFYICCEMDLSYNKKKKNRGYTLHQKGEHRSKNNLIYILMKDFIKRINFGAMRKADKGS